MEIIIGFENFKLKQKEKFKKKNGASRLTIGQHVDLPLIIIVQL